MSVVSPFKKNLLRLQITPPKAIVGNDINSWQQTNQKIQRRRINKPRCNSRSTHYAPQQKTQPCQMSNLASLREKRMKLMESSCKKKSSSQQTLANSVKSSPKRTQLRNPENSNNSGFLQNQDQFKLKIQQIKVSQFKEQDGYILKPLEIKFRPTRQNPLPSLTQKNQQQIKNTLHRLRKLQNNLTNSHKITASHAQESYKSPNQHLKNIIFKARKIVPIRQNCEPIEALQ